MRVGIDARSLTSARPSGVEHYVINLIRSLAALPERPDITAYTDGPLADAEVEEAIGDKIQIKAVRARRGWLRGALPWRLWRDRVQVAHFPSTILPPLLPCPAVVTVHDLAWMRYPETYDAADLEMQTQVVPRSIRRARRVIAVSENTARDLAEMLGVPRDKITVVALGVSSEFSPEGGRPPRYAFSGAERLAEGCVLHAAGGFHPRKNVARVLEAYARAKGRCEMPPLVVAGGQGSQSLEDLKGRTVRLGIAEDVIFPGHLPEAVLAACLRAAVVAVYPSLYEGFGLPILEAMASGTPVITSDRSSMVEVAGEAALLVNPEDVEELASALVRILSDEALRGDLRARGLARSREFSWQRTAQQTVAVYRRAARAG